MNLFDKIKDTFSNEDEKAAAQAAADQAATDNDHIVGSDHPLMIPARIAGPGLG